MRVYSVKCTKPFMVLDLKARMSKFIFGVSGMVSKECKTVMLIIEMDISHLMNYEEQIEDVERGKGLGSLRKLRWMVVDSSTKEVVAMVSYKVVTSKEIKGHQILIHLCLAKIRGQTQSPKKVWVHKLLQSEQSVESSIRVKVYAAWMFDKNIVRPAIFHAIVVVEIQGAKAKVDKHKEP